MTDAELTKIYNDANGIPEGKAPPITTQRIFTAMRAMRPEGRYIDFHGTPVLVEEYGLVARDFYAFGACAIKDGRRVPLKDIYLD